MGQTNAWTSEVDWTTGQWRERTQAQVHHAWQRPSPRGVLAKRPLTFFEVLDSGFRLLRFVPGPTLGSALIVFTLWTLALTAIGTFFAIKYLPFLTELESNEDALSGFLMVSQLGSFAIGVLSLGVVHFLTGLASFGTEHSFSAERTTLAQSWQSLHGRRLRLVLATMLMTAINTLLLALLSVPAILLATFESFGTAIAAALSALLLWVCAVAWLNLRFAFLGAVIATEKLGLRAALARSWTLSRRGFWRTLGQLALGYFISNQLVQLIIAPFLMVLMFAATILIGLSAESETITAGIALVIGAIVLGLTAISSAVLFSYFSCLVSVCYFDQRMRSEGLDLVLIRRAETRA